VQVHCAALSRGLLESELFGHVKGAFTGAYRDRVGRFEMADGGSLFLDEIGDISLETQTKLLRVLQEMAFERVGGTETIKVDVRLIAATNQDLERLIEAGRFREDLFYRLNVISIHTPPLRERKEDVFELALHFLSVYGPQLGKRVTGIDEEALEALVRYAWPGNVRELENVIERAVVMTDGPMITLDDLPHGIAAAFNGELVGAAAVRPAAAVQRQSHDGSFDGAAGPRRIALTGELTGYERGRLVEALQHAQGNKSEAARALGLPRSTFFSKLKKYGLT
jgi:transcriptional regulator with GAF, ATPase, and Fis domain